MKIKNLEFFFILKTLKFVIIILQKSNQIQDFLISTLKSMSIIAQSKKTLSCCAIKPHISCSIFPLWITAFLFYSVVVLGYWLVYPPYDLMLFISKTHSHLPKLATIHHISLLHRQVVFVLILPIWTRIDAQSIIIQELYDVTGRYKYSTRLKRSMKLTFGNVKTESVINECELI